MDFQEKTLVCFDCKATYTFSAEDQQAFHSKGHNHPPKRCPACRATRAAKKAAHPVEREKPVFAFVPPANRQMFKIICSECGKETQVPFEPKAGRPVYCSDCYHKTRTNK